jgi:hypothetical protein
MRAHTYYIVYNSNSEECVVAQDTAIEHLICWREDLPSSAPSSTPSSEPSLSFIPSSLSSKPSTQPLLSEKPSSKPISPIQDIDFIARDTYNRRYFPEIPVRSEGIPYQPVPDCSLSIGRVGYIAIPSPFEVALLLGLVLLMLHHLHVIKKENVRLACPFQELPTNLVVHSFH